MMQGVKMMALAGGMALAMSGMVLAGSHGGAKKMAAMDVVKERQQVMKEIKERFVPLVKVVKGAQPFEAAVVKKNAEEIAALLEKAEKLFPAGSDKGDTRAKPEIWQMNDEFKGLFRTAIAKARAIAGVSSAEQLPGAVMALGGQGCKACHEKFRKPKGQ